MERIIIAGLKEIGMAEQLNASSGIVIISVYIVSGAIVLLGIFLLIRAIKIKREVQDDYRKNMAILEDWNRAIALAYSGNESHILVSLDILWALNDPLMYPETQPILHLLSNHANEAISMRAKDILEKQVTSLPHLRTPDS